MNLEYLGDALDHWKGSLFCLGSAGIGVRPFFAKEDSALRAGIFKA
jgi:hypothetical protein